MDALKSFTGDDFRFHDCRHCFASHFVMRGGSLKDLQEILGHKSLTMTMRYAHLSQEHKKKAVNLLNGLTAPQKGTCHKTVTSGNVPKTATTKPLDFTGATGRIRTVDILITSEVLCQLSYGGPLSV